MKARIVAQYGLGSGVTDILALPDACAVALSNYGRNLFLLQDGRARSIPLAGHARIARRASGISIVDRQFHQGALFPFGAGFGVIFVDVLHLWEGPAAAPHTLELRNSLAQRDSAPISAAPVPERAEIVVLLDDALHTGSGRFLARVQLDEASAVWRDQPRELAYAHFRHAALPQSNPPHASGIYPEIIDVVALSATRLRVHAVGKPGSHAHYGLAYSVLADVDEHWGTTPLATLESGYGTFATDRRVLLLRYVHARAPGRL